MGSRVRHHPRVTEIIARGSFGDRKKLSLGEEACLPTFEGGSVTVRTGVHFKRISVNRRT